MHIGKSITQSRQERSRNGSGGRQLAEAHVPNDRDTAEALLRGRYQAAATYACAHDLQCHRPCAHQCVGKYQSCMVHNGRLLPRASYGADKWVLKYQPACMFATQRLHTHGIAAVGVRFHIIRGLYKPCMAEIRLRFTCTHYG